MKKRNNMATPPILFSFFRLPQSRLTDAVVSDVCNFLNQNTHTETLQ